MDRMNVAVNWYQSKIGNYDKQWWEQSVEQRILQGLENRPKKEGSLKEELIDIDMVRGSAFSKAKPQHGWLSVMGRGVARVGFAPLYLNYWRHHTGTRFAYWVLFHYLLQLVQLALFAGLRGHQASPEEVLVPLLLALALGMLHAQIVSPHGGKKKKKAAAMAAAAAAANSGTTGQGVGAVPAPSSRDSSPVVAVKPALYVGSNSVGIGSVLKVRRTRRLSGRRPRILHSPDPNVATGTETVETETEHVPQQPATVAPVLVSDATVAGTPMNSCDLPAPAVTMRVAKQAPLSAQEEAAKLKQFIDAKNKMIPDPVSYPSVAATAAGGGGGTETASTAATIAQQLSPTRRRLRSSSSLRDSPVRTCPLLSSPTQPGARRATLSRPTSLHVQPTNARRPVLLDVRSVRSVDEEPAGSPTANAEACSYHETGLEETIEREFHTGSLQLLHSVQSVDGVDQANLGGIRSAHSVDSDAPSPLVIKVSSDDSQKFFAEQNWRPVDQHFSTTVVNGYPCDLASSPAQQGTLTANGLSSSKSPSLSLGTSPVETLTGGDAFQPRIVAAADGSSTPPVTPSLSASSDDEEVGVPPSGSKTSPIPIAISGNTVLRRRLGSEVVRSVSVPKGVRGTSSSGEGMGSVSAPQGRIATGVGGAGGVEDVTRVQRFRHRSQTISLDGPSAKFHHDGSDRMWTADQVFSASNDVDGVPSIVVSHEAASPAEFEARRMQLKNEDTFTVNSRTKHLLERVILQRASIQQQRGGVGGLTGVSDFPMDAGNTTTVSGSRAVRWRGVVEENTILSGGSSSPSGRVLGKPMHTSKDHLDTTDHHLQVAGDEKTAGVLSEMECERMNSDVGSADDSSSGPEDDDVGPPGTTSQTAEEDAGDANEAEAGILPGVTGDGARDGGEGGTRAEGRPNDPEDPFVLWYRETHHGSHVHTSAVETVSCFIWEGGMLKKADLTLLDIGWCIIQAVERHPRSTEYTRSGFLVAALLACLPLFFRTYCAWPELVHLALTVVTGDGFVSHVGQMAGMIMGKQMSSRFVFIIGVLLRLNIYLSVFFLLSVAEKTFKQRLEYAKHFCYLTSSRRARKHHLPHFRLNKVRNIKLWLSLRSYLKRCGPQRSVDGIIGAAFYLILIVASLLCIRLLRDPDSATDQLVTWELGACLLVLGLYLLRFLSIGTKITKKYRNLSVLITEQINLYLSMEKKPHKKEELLLANNVLRLAEDLLKEVDGPFRICGWSLNPLLYNILKVVILSACSAVLSGFLGFKLKLYKIRLNPANW